MNILSMLGLMKVEDHEAAISELDDTNYLAWSKMANERDDMSASRADMMHTIAKMQVENKRLASGWDKCGDELNQVKRERDDARRGFLNAQAKFVAAAKDLADQADELATFRAKRDRDNAQRRERHARKANDAAPKAKKGVRS